MNNIKEHTDVKVTVNVDVPRIIKYLSVAAVLIIAIIFGTRCVNKTIEQNNRSNL